MCRHQEGIWNGVSSDQTGEQTTFRIDKGGIDGMALAPERVAEWIDSFPVATYISDTLEHIYPDTANKDTEY